MEPSFPWLDLASVVAQALIAISVGLLAYSQHSTKIKIQRIYKIHEWGSACLDVFAECEHFCKLPNPHFTEEDIFLRRREILNRLSSLINQGRIYYDNLGNEEQHQGEYPVDTGYRPVILDPLVAAYRVLISLDDINLIPDSELAVRIENWRKFFLSLIKQDVSSKWLKYQTEFGSTLQGIPGYRVTESSDAPSWKQFREYQHEMKKILNQSEKRRQ